MEEQDYNIPLCVPPIGKEEKNAVIEVLESGWLAHGEYNKKFETGFSDYLGVKHAITMNSATSALEIALKANKIKGEVIIPSFTFVATANSVITSGATPVFCDVDLATRNMTAEHIEPFINSKTEAIIVVHFAGQPCEMTEILKLCQKHNLLLIEDSAETLGATWEEKQAGSFGVGCFSFFPTKNITTGEGGMFTTNDVQIAQKAKCLIAHGISSTTFAREKSERPWFRSAIISGHNYRMSNILAAIGYYQLKKIDKMNASRIKLASHYNYRIKELNQDIKTPVVANGASHVYQMYTIEVPAENRNQWLLNLRDKGVGASVHFDPAVHQQEYYKNYNIKQNLANTELLASSLITLPIYPDMSIEQVDYVVDKMSETFK